jgi:hypothetical protein
MSTIENTCGCGCSTMTVVTNASEAYLEVPLAPGRHRIMITGRLGADSDYTLTVSQLPKKKRR